MQELTLLILLATAASLGGVAAIAFRFFELTRGAPVIGDGSELIGSVGHVVAAVDNGAGWILIENQRWRAGAAAGTSYPAIQWLCVN